MDSISYHIKSAPFCDDIRYRVYERVIMSRPYPIIEYAHSIGKNTSEFTTKDLDAYMKWWMKQKPRRDILEGTPAQKATYKKDVENMNKFRDAQTSRLPKSLADPMSYEEDVVVEEMNLKVDEPGSCEEIVVEMGLTRLDVEALKFVLGRIFEDYEMEGHEYGKSLADLKESLERT